MDGYAVRRIDVLGAFGESLANFDNFCEIDANLKDAWDIPALRISMAHGKNEANSSQAL